MPFKKGSIPPWEFVNELMKLNGNLAFDKLKRTLEHQHPLLVITFLKRKIDELYYNKILIESGITSFQDRAKIIKANQWSIKNITNLTNKVSLSVLEYLVYYIYNVEDNFKGNGIISDEKTYLENVIGNIYVSLRYNIKGGNQ